MSKKILALSSFGLGVFLLVQVFMPLVSFKLWEATVYNQNQALISPHPDTQVLGISIKNLDSSNFPAFYSTNQRSSPSPYQDFILSIPSLNLENLKVVVDTNNFDQNLALMPGTALPGEKGNVFITGHSSLPQLFRPGNYKAIFAHLPEIKKGAEVVIDASNQTFTYVVEGLKIVNPKETWVINPPDQEGRYLTLMTCVPPGLYLKRLVVLAKLK